jgi:hypothetical protein
MSRIIEYLKKSLAPMLQSLVAVGQVSTQVAGNRDLMEAQSFLGVHSALRLILAVSPAKTPPNIYLNGLFASIIQRRFS